MATANTGAMVMAMILVGYSSSMSVVGSRVASQASVPHQDVALAISLLALRSKIGRAIGSAIVAVIWADQMPKSLRKYLPSNATEGDVKKLFGSTKSIRKLYGFDDPMRVGASQNAVANVGNNGLPFTKTCWSEVESPKSKKDEFLRFLAGK
ncbi:hypothetical protein BDV39DRAFT_204556 [Aspergillus sergii]|uniref:Uncharacterized protein n=1 Tax=Aspergillus sergii TaxID=1034303 RepID=A0A5N6X4I5_9EURO|nr:hypothetical protein BDV39DRAFT_204556 [Aspergillus sergii]